jgi:hypothetical protein
MYLARTPHALQWIAQPPGAGGAGDAVPPDELVSRELDDPATLAFDVDSSRDARSKSSGPVPLRIASFAPILTQLGYMTQLG